MLEPLLLVHGDDPFLVTSAALRRREELTADLVEACKGPFEQAISDS